MNPLDYLLIVFTLSIICSVCVALLALIVYKRSTRPAKRYPRYTVEYIEDLSDWGVPTAKNEAVFPPRWSPTKAETHFGKTRIGIDRDAA